MTDGVDLGFGAHVVRRSDERWAACWCVCKNGVVCAQKKVRTHVGWVVVAGGSGEMQSAGRVSCCLRCVHCEQRDGGWAVYGCPKGSVNGDEKLGGEAGSTLVCLMVGAR